MKRTLLVCLALALTLGALPTFAGTVYIPILSDNGVDDAEYLTRIWITNESGQAQTVETLLLPMNTDGTKGRDDSQKATETTRVAAGRTVVLEISSGSGMLELSSDGEIADLLAVNAEVRNMGLDGAGETHTTVPILSSRNLAGSGETQVLQGLRRTDNGIFSNLLITNLGHEESQCTVQVFRANGQQIAGTALLTLKALSQVQFPDALNLLGQTQIGDVNARLSCDQPFFTYLSLYERETGEVIFVRPSATVDSELARPGDQQPSVPGAVLFTRNGAFHEPTKAEPSAIFNIPVPPDSAFSNVVVDFDFFHGGWYAKDPSGLHSLLWLHRGACCWPKWAENITTFANAHGPGKNQIKMISNMDLPKAAGKSKGDANFALQPGQNYHAHFEYDTLRGRAWLQISQNGNEVMYVDMPTTVNRLRPDESAAWMIYFGHEDIFGQGIGAERPSYGWEFKNLRVEFIP
jgi:hypothetical protein